MGLLDRRRGGIRGVSPVDTQIDVLVASAEAVRLKDGYEYRRSLPVWQRQALEFYDLVGESWYPAQFYARMLSRLRLYPAIEKPNNEHEEIEDATAQKILQRVQARRWLATYGQLQFLIGDGYLTVSLDDDGEERWEYLSPAELLIEDRQYRRRLGDGLEDRMYDKVGHLDVGLTEREMKAWRLWRRHPTMSQMADSPMRAVVGLLTYLMHLDKAALAAAVSRIVGTGLLLVDERITIPASDAETADESMAEDPFMARLIDYIVRPISQPGSAAAQAPLVARVSAQEAGKVQDLIHYLRFHDPNQTTDWEAKVEKTIRRLSIALDMPPAELLGLENANQWTGWLIGEDRWKAHGEPITIQLCDDLTSAYFRQACREADVENADHLVVWFDAAQVVTHPDQGKAAEEVHDRGGLNDAALRKAHNFAESDGPSPEERESWEIIKLRQRDRPQDPSEADARATGSHVEPGAPDNNGRKTNQPSPQPDNQQLRVLGAAELTLDRLRERAGGYIRSRRRSCDECLRGTEDVPAAELAAHLGSDVVRSLDISSDLALVSGGADVFALKLVHWGYGEHESKVIAGVLEGIAAETLYDQQATLPDDFLSVLANPPDQAQLNDKALERLLFHLGRRTSEDRDAVA